VIQFRAVRFELGDAVLDLETRLLFRGGTTVHLSPKAFDFLALLVRERPRAITKRELHEHIWAGVSVSDASLAVVAGEVRAALGETARRPHRIRTLHGVGYAFDGEVRVVGEEFTTKHFLTIGDRVVSLRAGDNVVGRDSGVEITIHSAMVSRSHARLRITADAATIEDLESKNGTWRGAARITVPVTLSSGDVIRFGSIAATYSVGAQATATIADPVPADRPATAPAAGVRRTN
jgi:DNA-binding winged helix-turn-helix (wHTH) protein